jgi:hypothetical protein
MWYKHICIFTHLSQELTHAVQFKEQWLSMCDSSITGAPAQSRMGKKLNTLIQDSELSDKESLQEIGLNVPDDPQQPWLCDYRAYMDVPEQDLPDGWTPVQWWGVSNLVLIAPTTWRN